MARSAHGAAVARDACGGARRGHSRRLSRPPGHAGHRGPQSPELAATNSAHGLVSARLRCDAGPSRSARSWRVCGAGVTGSVALLRRRRHGRVGRPCRTCRRSNLPSRADVDVFEGPAVPFSGRPSQPRQLLVGARCGCWPSSRRGRQPRPRVPSGARALATDCSWSPCCTRRPKISNPGRSSSCRRATTPSVTSTSPGT